MSGCPLLKQSCQVTGLTPNTQVARSTANDLKVVNKRAREANMLKMVAARLAAGVATLALLAAVPALGQGKTLKFVQNGNLTILDPIWTTAYVTATTAT
jgi:hypothetical protein